jgi:hypothetical protein
MREMSARLLRDRTGQDVEWWNRRIEEEGPADKGSLRKWLTEQGVTGYARSLLVMERFGYPDYLTASAAELIDGQYADRPELRPVFDAIVEAAEELGEVVVQARKTYVSLVSPRRTFARVRPTTRTRVDLALRLEGQEPVGRLRPSRIQEHMKVQIGLSAPEELDEEALAWLRQAYEENG